MDYGADLVASRNEKSGFAVTAPSWGRVKELLYEAVALSPQVRAEFLDVFPPAAPAGLAAVATAPATGAQGTQAAASIDLSWQANTEADLGGYIVYRREEGADWQRVSPAQPVLAPAFHDAHVEPGRTYVYAVSALDQSGHESARSAEARETVPRP